MVTTDDSHRDVRVPPPDSSRAIRSTLWRAYHGLALGFVTLVLAVSFWSIRVYRQENLEIKRRVEHLTVRGESESATMRRVARYVIENVPSRRVDAYFLLPCFRMLKPTALQILEGGGDCAYKARAFIVMLKHASIDAHKLALHDDSNVPVHAVAVAETERGRYIVDLHYGIIFENERHNPIALQSLMTDPRCLHNVVQREIAGGNARAAAYDLDRYNYRTARTINWEKTWLSARAREVLSAVIGRPAVDRLPRPYLAEEPALMVLLLGAAGLMLVGSPYFLAWCYRRLPGRDQRRTARCRGGPCRRDSATATELETHASG